MKKETQTIAQQLGITKFPFSINNDKGNQIYFENSNGFWTKHKFDSNNNQIYFENSCGYWGKYEYDSNGNRIYYENSNGEIKDERPKVVELSIEEIANKLGIDSKHLKIVDK